MQSGQVDRLFEVLERTDQKDKVGQIKPVWSPVGQFYGAVNPVSIQSFVNSNAQGSAVVCRINMRPDDFPTLTAAHLLREVDTQEVYKIEGILPVNRSKQTLMCNYGKLHV